MPHPVRTGIHAVLLCSMLTSIVHAQTSGTPPPSPIAPEREQQLVRMVRQDCGSCHGLQLTGGLGPSLTKQALTGKPPEYLKAVITHGLPGTPMPPWQALLNNDETDWVARRLADGFPEERKD